MFGGGGGFMIRLPALCRQEPARSANGGKSLTKSPQSCERGAKPSGASREGRVLSYCPQQLTKCPINSAKEKYIEVVTFQNSMAHIKNSEIANSVNQSVTEALPPVRPVSKSHHAEHEFRWIPTKKEGTAWCLCDGWTLWNCSEAFGRRNHRLHLANLPQQQVMRQTKRTVRDN